MQPETLEVTTKGELENVRKDMGVPEIWPMIDCHVINVQQLEYPVGDVCQSKVLLDESQ